MSKEQFDKLVGKWISRKLLVFLFATLFSDSIYSFYTGCGLLGISAITFILSIFKS